MKTTPSLILALILSQGSVLLTSSRAAETTSSPPATLSVPAPPVTDKIDDYIIQSMAKSGIKAMSIAIVDGGKIVKVKGYGFADADGKIPVTARTLFQAASISKVFTAVGALHLVDDKRLVLDDDVNTKLTSWKVPESDLTKVEKVTLRRLIAHMGGINIGGFWGYHNGEPIPSLLDILNGKPPANSPAIRVNWVPGTKTEYSGGGYCIIQQLLIDVTGQSFEDYMRDTVFKPLGMVNSTFECPLPADKAVLAAHAFGPWNDAMAKSGKFEYLPWGWNNYPEKAPAGLWTNAEDLARFIMDVQDTHAGRSTKVLSKDAVDKMLTLVPGSQWKTMGLGLVLEKPGQPNAIFRASGTNAGFQAQFTGTVETRQGAVVLYNDRKGESIPDEIILFIAKEYGWLKFR